MNYYQFRVASRELHDISGGTPFNFVSRRSIGQKTQLPLGYLLLPSGLFPDLRTGQIYFHLPARKMPARKIGATAPSVYAIFIFPTSSGRRGKAITRLLVSEILQLSDYFREFLLFFFFRFFFVSFVLFRFNRFARIRWKSSPGGFRYEGQRSRINIAISLVRCDAARTFNIETKCELP